MCAHLAKRDVSSIRIEERIQLTYLGAEVLWRRHDWQELAPKRRHAFEALTTRLGLMQSLVAGTFLEQCWCYVTRQ